MRIKSLFITVLLLTATFIYGQSKSYFISPDGDDNASGLSLKTAWKSLEKVNQTTFLPGDRVLFESGGVWYGQLQPKGSGEKGKPITLSSYGEKGKPVINIGSAEGAGIRLFNQSWWEIHNMEITSGAPAELGVGRQGIAIIVKGDGQHMEGIVIKNNYIHDIWGQLGGRGEYVGYYSTAILVRSQYEEGLSRKDRALVKTTFDNVLVENNRIERFDKCGIVVWGGKHHIVVRKNYMDNLGGDGIFVNGPYRGLIEYNEVRRSCMRSGYMDLPGGDDWWPHTAAIWIQNTEETIMQFNEVYDTGREPKNGDGNAYDFDFYCTRCIAQYNYSKNNHGFMLVMNNTSGNITRYNISENDKSHLIQIQSNLTDENVFHNNVFYADYGTADIDFHGGENGNKEAIDRLGALFYNNIFYASGQARFRTVYSFGPVIGRTFDEVSKPNFAPGSLFLNNCYYGPWKNGLPDDPKKVVADPLFVAPGTGGNGLYSLNGYQLQAGSPCINSGLPVPLPSKRDYYGNPVNDSLVDIGAYEQSQSGASAGIMYKQADFPLFIDPIYNGSSDPVVCYNKKSGKWYMYYTSRRVNRRDISAIERIHGSPIGIAESTDGGATWSYIGDCNIDYKPDPEPTYWAPEILEHEGLYHMYLSYVPGVFKSWDHPRDIVHLTSKDGINWETQSVLNLASRKVIDAGIIRLKNGIWRMWYKHEGRDNEIWYADSEDLYNWTDKGEVKLGGLHGEGANVIYWHDKYYLIVDEWKGLSVFSSDDATNWKKQDEYLVAEDPKHPQYVAGSRGNHADIQVAGDRAYMFYFSHTPANSEIQGLAVYAQELIYNPDGTISCNPTAPCYINLNAGRKE